MKSVRIEIGKDTEEVKKLKYRITQLEREVSELRAANRTISESRDYYYDKHNAKWPGEDLY